MLTATKINSVVNKQAMDCLNVCLFDVRCEAFNAYKSDDDVDMCDFFDKDRCSAGVSLVDSDAGSAYFDNRGNDECPKPSKCELGLSFFNRNTEDCQTERPFEHKKDNPPNVDIFPIKISVDQKIP